MPMIFRLLVPALLVFAINTPAEAASVLMISVDGMKPEYVLQADAHGLKVPYLRSLMADGAYADGVVGVWPTVTYPSHTTLVTGVLPAEHGIVANLQFDPRRRFEDAWFWYASEVKVPTLWQAAHAKGLVTASIGWPVTVGATGIDFLIPEYWRSSGATDDLDPSERSLIAALTLPTGLLAQVQSSAGLYMKGNDTTVHGDDIKTRYALELLRQHKPAFMTVHLSSLDDAEHDHGVFSPEANQNLEAIDTMVATLARVARDNDSSTVIVVVSDHGFTPMHHEINLYVPFISAGLMTTAVNPETHALEVASWRAEPWLGDGMAAIMLHDPQDPTIRAAVGKLLHTLAADPKNGIAAIKNRDEIKPLGAFPDAEFLVVFKPGFDAGEHLTGGILGIVQGTHGDHGFSPDYPDMRSSFFATGVGIAPHRDIGIIRMLQIAPTVARLLGVDLIDAKASALDLKP
jgi:predicted AlkP superfamily pyrophosphatase or phosphodiesterase